MGQVTGAALQIAVLPEPANPNRIAPQQARAQAQAIASAVQVINRAGIVGGSREVTYSTDSATKQLVVQVVDRQSKEVIVQWPSAYALEMAQDYQKEHSEK
jgi:uncharacterized FlaG/YvyC family protein